MANDLRKAWDRQWGGNILSTCAHHLDPNAAQEIGAGWAAFFGTLPQGARTLDIGTGNGILPLIALQVSEATNMGFEVYGADYAAIDPMKALPDQAALLSKITFHPNTATEKLSFPDSHFDAVTAQHAFEYGEHAASAKEIARVLKPDGRIRFLMHASGGAIVEANLCKIEQARFIVEEVKLFQLVAKAAESGQGDDLKAALSTTSQKFAGDPSTQDLEMLLELLWGAYEQRDKFENEQAFQHWLAENEAELLAQSARIGALKAASLEEKAMQTIIQHFADAGVKANFAAVEIGGAKVGWLLEGQK